jgi:hypothetical protein
MSIETFQPYVIQSIESFSKNYLGYRPLLVPVVDSSTTSEASHCVCFHIKEVASAFLMLPYTVHHACLKVYKIDGLHTCMLIVVGLQLCKYSTAAAFAFEMALLCTVLCRLVDIPSWSCSM